MMGEKCYGKKCDKHLKNMGNISIKRTECKQNSFYGQMENIFMGQELVAVIRGVLSFFFGLIFTLPTC